MTQDFSHFLKEAEQIIAEHRAEYHGEYYMKGGGWNPIRDVLETAGSLTGNYLLPGSSIVTSRIASKGSQDQLNSSLGKIGQVGTSLAGEYGSDTFGIPSASEVGAGWGNAAKAVGLTGEGSLLGTSAGTPVEGGVGPTQGSGVIGSATRGLSDVGNSFSSLFGSGVPTSSLAGDQNALNATLASPSGTSAMPNTGGGLFSNIFGTGGASSAASAASGGSSGIGNIASAIYGGYNSLSANDQAQKDLENAEKQSLGQLNPYLQSGNAANTRLSDLLGTSGNTGASGYGSLSQPFTANDLQNDPGYKFQLQQGNQALDRQEAAKGNYFSGSALKAAQDYGQGLADSTLNQAFQRYLQGNQQQYGQLAGQAGVGASAANQAGNIYTGIGNAKAGAGIESSNIMNQTLSSLLSGSGAKRPINVGGQTYYV